MFERDADQQLFEETTKRFLESACPSAKIRDLAGTKAGFEPDFWRQGAALGWTSLLVPEAAGGGSVSDHGLLDLMLVAYQFGLHAAPGPLLACNLVAAALARWGGPGAGDGLLDRLLAGDAVAAWAVDGTCTARPSGDGFVLDGAASPVEAGTEAEAFLVGDANAMFLVPADATGLRVTRLNSLDLTRRFARVELEGVQVPAGAQLPGADPAWLAAVAGVLQLAEMVGTMQWAFDTTLDWVTNRYSFGRPLASYQEIKHRFADMKMWLEASHAITAAAGRAVAEQDEHAAERLSAGKFYVGRYGPELVQDCVQLHGGIGVTFDHDIHLFLRRVAINVPLLGSPAQHARRLADLLEAREA